MKKIFFLLLLLPFSLNAQWYELHAPGAIDYGSQMPVYRDYFMSFQCGSKIYYGAGSMYTSVGNHYFRDFYCYDMITMRWSRKNDFPFSLLTVGYTTSLNGKGYLLTCYRGFSNNFISHECWEYDTLTDNWLQLPDFPGIAGTGLTTLRSGNFVYLLSTGDSTHATSTNFLWRMDPVSHTWLQMNVPVFIGRSNARSFTINNTPYITGGGDSLGNTLTDLWMYDETSDQWIQKSATPFPFSKVVTESNQAWGVGGVNDSLYRYDPIADSWTSTSTLILASNAIGAVTDNIYQLLSNSSVEKYNIPGDSLSITNPAPIDIYGSSVVMSDHAYVGNNLYDFANDSWTFDSTMDPNARWYFCINDTCFTNHGGFSSYNYNTHIYTPRASLSSGGAVIGGFAANGKGYLTVDIGGAIQLWEYNPVLDSWAQRTSFPGTYRYYEFIFSIGNKGYLLSGIDASTYLEIGDFWEYDPVADTWTQKSSPPLSYINVATGTASAGYIGQGEDEFQTGYYGFAEYNPQFDSWSVIGYPISETRLRRYLFTYHDMLYIGGGSERLNHQDYLSHFEFYRYNTSIVNSVSESSKMDQYIIYPSIVSDKVNIYSKTKISSIKIFDSIGKLIFNKTGLEKNELTVPVDGWANGIYFLIGDLGTIGKFVKQ